MAFHPGYATNGFFFIYYTNGAGDLELARYRVSANPNVADDESKVIIKTIPHPINSNHNGGELHFEKMDFCIYLRAMEEGADLSSLRAAVSAGETLPAPVYDDWIRKTGKPMLDGIGATEMLHIFITNRFGDSAPACTGRPVTGYEARIVDEQGQEMPRGAVGRLAVRGPTGCRYLDDDRQGKYVRDVEYRHEPFCIHDP